MYYKNNIEQTPYRKRLLNNTKIYNLLAIRSYLLNNFIIATKKEMANTRKIMRTEYENYINSSKKDNSEIKVENTVENNDLSVIYFAEWYESYSHLENQSNTEISNTNNGDKILVILSCHTDTKLRLVAIHSIMKYLTEVDNIDIVVVNSSRVAFSNNVKSFFKNIYMDYYELENDQCFGFSKWYYGLINTQMKYDFSKYKFTTFINDSIILHNSITHFFDYTRIKNVDLYGINNSSQVHLHYQSYLFSVKNTAINNFIRLFNDNKRFVKSYNDAVTRFELNLFNYFSSRDCFLKIAYFPSQIGKNIFFNNDFLYFRLLKSGLLPITKLRRITK